MVARGRRGFETLAPRAKQRDVTLAGLAVAVERDVAAQRAALTIVTATEPAATPATVN